MPMLLEYILSSHMVNHFKKNLARNIFSQREREREREREKTLFNRSIVRSDFRVHI